MPTLYDSINSIDDVQSLIDQNLHESEVLEYKTVSVPVIENDRKEIAKDVSAMANSLGGVIIYGVAADSNIKTLPHHIQDIDPKWLSTFEQVLNSQVRPPIAGIRWKAIPPDRPRVMVVDIPQSEDPPHQSLKHHRYYRRSGTECLPMEHDLIAMHFGRRLGPILDLQPQAFHKMEKFEGNPPMSSGVLLRLGIKNNGKRVARHVLALLVFPGNEHLTLNRNWGGVESIDDLHPGKQARQYSEALAVIHPFSTRRIAEFVLSVSRDFFDRHADDPFIEWTVFADEMAPRSGSATLRDLKWA